MKILVINGPNMNMLGIREPEIYGKETYGDLISFIKEGMKDNPDLTLDFFQSNHEGAIVDEIQNAFGRYQGIVINPAAYTHTSLAIADAIKAVGIPTVEVHLTDPEEREEYRRVSFVKEACVETIKGRGFQGYLEAIQLLIKV